ncbi:hypothetical protein J6590_083494 [Homalodisca vitripennis]|nr:hypothetical protein J6590_083494 [Homalodisca vitripennis]
MVKLEEALLRKKANRGKKLGRTKIAADTLEKSAIKVEKEKSKLSAYSAPNPVLHPGELDALLGCGDTVIVGGDVNASTPPVDPTHYPPHLNALPDVIVVFLFKDLQHQSDVRVVDDLSSDHMPVMAEVAISPAAGTPPTDLL